MRGIKLAAAALAVWGAVGLAPARAQLGATGPAPESADIKRAQTDTTSGKEVDPWEKFNRRMFKGYLFLDDNILVPAARGYRAVTFKKERKGIANFLANVKLPNVLFNDLLQGNLKRGGQTTARFLINTTIGLFGFADPAAKLGIPPHTEDFGQTLAVWGVPSGPFLFLPLFGPTTIRDGFGLGVDYAADPLTWLRSDPASYARYSRFGMTIVSTREPLIEPLDQIRTNSLDYYASLRSFYLQARKREIANGVTSYEDLPDIGDYEEMDEIQ
ncbi:MAG: VacJ family lipoprotein [Alphaproteobacteria bacterium]|nr:VacJ family lipoprotein [Alphaproteobacteria bacterium]